MSRRSRNDAPPPRRRSRPKARNRILFIAGILVLAVGAFYTALVVATQIDQIFFPGNEIQIGGILGNVPGIDKGNTSNIGSGGRINILVMGLDRRPYEGNAPSRTDTMFVLSIDPGTKTARGLAIPRDLWVNIPSPNGTFQDRVNTAYIYGENGHYPGGGIRTVETTVENLLGIKIDYYVLIDFQGFKKIIDSLGGIDVDVPPSLAVDDPYYSETELLGDYYPCIFDAGMHHMDASDALCFSRTRFNSSDLDRILRQQLVIFAVMDKATSLNLLSSVDNMVSLWKRYKDTITTDINDQQIPGFARLATQIHQDQITLMSLAPATTPYTIPSTGAEVLLPSEEGVKQIVDAFLADNKLNTENATVEVQNATGVDGAATQAIDYFTSLGIPQSSLIAVNNAATTSATTQIIDFTGKTYTAQRLAGWLSVPSSSIRKATAADASLRTSNADIVVILGSDARVDAAFASPTQSP